MSERIMPTYWHRQCAVPDSWRGCANQVMATSSGLTQPGQHPHARYTDANRLALIHFAVAQYGFFRVSTQRNQLLQIACFSIRRDNLELRKAPEMFLVKRIDRIERLLEQPSRMISVDKVDVLFLEPDNGLNQPICIFYFKPRCVKQREQHLSNLFKGPRVKALERPR